MAYATSAICNQPITTPAWLMTLLVSYVGMGLLMYTTSFHGDGKFVVYLIGLLATSLVWLVNLGSECKVPPGWVGGLWFIAALATFVAMVYVWAFETAVSILANPFILVTLIIYGTVVVVRTLDEIHRENKKK